MPGSLPPEDEIARLRAENEMLNRLLTLRTRQNTQGSELWCKAAEAALRGDLRALNDRVVSWRDPARFTYRIVQSGDDHAR